MNQSFSVCVRHLGGVFLALALLVPLAFGAPVSGDEKYVEGVVLKGENAQSILTQYITLDEFRKLFQATKAVYDLSKIRSDYSYGLVTSETEGLKAFEYQINQSKKVVVFCKQGVYTAAIKPASFEIAPKEKLDTETVDVPAPKKDKKRPQELEKADLEPEPEPEPREIRIIPDLPAEAPRAPEALVLEGKVRKGESAQSILTQRLSLDEFRTIYQSTKKVYNLSRIRQGHNYRLTLAPKGGLKSFEYQIDRVEELRITRQKDGYAAEVRAIPYDVKLAVVKGKITSSLFKSIADAGENPDLAVLMADIFGAEINFIRDIRNGDSYEIAVEKRFSGGTFRHYGRIIGLRFNNDGTRYEGVRFPYGKNGDRYYNAKGENLHKSLLKAPLSFTRISSHYTANRKHPVFRDVRAHFGVDYAAPHGTPVKAVGDGVVIKAGWGTGFGRMIVIRHEGGLESMYAHLSAYARNLKAGSRVWQGQLIGYVGASGWATGPHLDFRLRKNGKYINPEKVVSSRSDPVAKKDRKRFNEQKAFVAAILDGKFKYADYKPGMLHLAKY